MIVYNLSTKLNSKRFDLNLKQIQPHLTPFHPHLIGGCSTGAGNHRNVSDLHQQVVIIDQRPRPLHLTSLETVLECPQVRVSKQPTEQVRRLRVAVAVRVWVCVPVGVCVGMLSTAVVVAGFKVDLGLRGGRRPISGAVPLAHEV